MEEHALSLDVEIPYKYYWGGTSVGGDGHLRGLGPTASSLGTDGRERGLGSLERQRSCLLNWKHWLLPLEAFRSIYGECRYFTTTRALGT